MYKRFCVNCGKEAEELIDGLCRSCYIRFIGHKEEEINVKTCIICNSVIFKNKKYSLEDFYKKLEKKFNGIVVDINENTIKMEIEPGILFLIKINYEKIICKNCRREMNEKFYNYVLQLRGSNKKISDILNIIKKRGYLIKNMEYTENGINLFLDLNRKEFKSILETIRNYTNNIKITRKVISYDKQSSRPRYKVFVSIRF